MPSRHFLAIEGDATMLYCGARIDGTETAVTEKLLIISRLL